MLREIGEQNGAGESGEFVETEVAEVAIEIEPIRVGER